MTLFFGDWRSVLAHVDDVNAVITDPPFGARTHEGARSLGQNEKTGGIEYAHWTPKHVDEFVDFWSPRCRGWFVAMTSHDLVPAWERSFAKAGRYAFAPVPCVMRGMTVRQQGDGPSSWCVWLMVARPRRKEFLGGWTNPGAYVGPAHGADDVNSRGVSGRGDGRGKPPWLCNAIVRDYSRPGDLVVDPCAGYGNILAAAEENGRRWIGSEIDPWVHEDAAHRLSRPRQLDLLQGAP